MILALVLPAGLHRQRVLAHGNAQIKRRAQFHAHRPHRVEQPRALAFMPGGRHPVGRKLDPLQPFQRRRAQVGDRLAHGHARRGLGVDQRQRRTLAQRHRLTGAALEIGQGDRAIRHRQLPRPHHLVARGQPTHGAVANRDQEALGRHRRMRQHPQPGLVQVDDLGVQRGEARRRRARLIAVHLGRLAEQHIHRQVDRMAACGRAAGIGRRHPVAHGQVFLGRGRAHHRERAALAPAQRGEFLQPLRRNAQHVAFLGFVAPQLHRRQRRIIAGHLVQIDHPAHVRVVQQLGDRVRQPARAHVVDGEDRVVFSQRHAAVDHFLAAALHFRVVTLHAGEIHRLVAGTAGHRAGSTAAQADQHRRPAQHDHQIARRQALLFHLDAVHRAQPAGQHDRLVVGPGELRVDRQLEAAEIAHQIRPPELIAERGRAQRPVNHDFHRRRHARVQRAWLLPRLRQGRDTQVRHRIPGQTGLGPAAAPGGALVADFTTHARRRAGIRRDRGGVVVGFHLDAERALDERLGAVLGAGRIRAEAARRVALHHRRVVAVGAQGVLGRGRMGVADHAEQRIRLVLAVHRPAGIEDLVPAVLGVRLGEHHQFHVGRVAAQRAEAVTQVFDLVLGQGQAQALVGFFQPGQRDPLQLAAARRVEQRVGLVIGAEQGLGHRIVQQPLQRCGLARALRPAHDIQPRAALHPLHLDPGVIQQLAGLAGPRRNGAQPRRNEARYRAFRQRPGAGPGLQDAPQRCHIGRRAGLRLDPVHMPGPHYAGSRREQFQTRLQALKPERRQGGLPLKDDHVRHT